MRVLLDEDVPAQLLVPLRAIARRHQIESVTSLQWGAKKDFAIYRDARQAGFEAIVTNDSRQLDDPEEVRAIARAGLHHIRYSQKHPGVRGLGLALGALIAALPEALDELELVDSQRLVHVTGLDPTKKRYVVQLPDEATKYWPRRSPRPSR